MNIREAVASIIGDGLAGSIIRDQGIHWAVVTAMCEARASDDPTAIATIRAWLRERSATGKEVSGEAD